MHEITVTDIGHVTAAGTQQVGFTADEHGTTFEYGTPRVTVMEDGEGIMLWTGRDSLEFVPGTPHDMAVAVAERFLRYMNDNVTPETWTDNDVSALCLMTAARETFPGPMFLIYPSSARQGLIEAGVAVSLAGWMDVKWG